MFNLHLTENSSKWKPCGNLGAVCVQSVQLTRCSLVRIKEAPLLQYCKRSAVILTCNKKYHNFQSMVKVHFGH